MEQNTKKQERRLEMVFLLAVFLTILMWAMVQPFNASPDEAMRYQIVDYIMRHGKLPVGYDAEIRDPNWGISYAFYPITTYIAGAVFGKIATLFFHKIAESFLFASNKCFFNLTLSIAFCVFKKKAILAYFFCLRHENFKNFLPRQRKRQPGRLRTLLSTVSPAA